MTLPFSEACERNKVPILSQLMTLIPHHARVFEIGSGTGQHAVFFSRQLPGVIWQTSELPERCSMLAARINETCSDEGGISTPIMKLPQPKPLTIGMDRLDQPYDVIFTANTTHIMPASLLSILFETASEGLLENGIFILYGPFKNNGQHNSPSNFQFDTSLRSQGFGGIPDVTYLTSLAVREELQFHREIDMPANNRLLVYKKM